jgi:hypothetical protein
MGTLDPRSAPSAISSSDSARGPKGSTASGEAGSHSDKANAAPVGPHAPPIHQSFWLWVMCLTGVDYFSTLAYQPSIAFESAGLLAPLATVVLILVTLFGALPVLVLPARAPWRHC